jgi:hypothetical protein
LRTARNAAASAWCRRLAWFPVRRAGHAARLRYRTPRCGRVARCGARGGPCASRFSEGVTRVPEMRS